MMNIEIDFDVFKKITSLRSNEQVTPNDVLRELLGLPRQNKKSLEKSSNSSWVTKGVAFPQGTEFEATYKGRSYRGVVTSGALLIEGKRFNSPSAAAVSITGNPVNGWNFWKCKFPNQHNWAVIANLRN